MKAHIMAHQSAVMTVMIKAARTAARSLRRDYFEIEALQVSRKGAADFVSSADTNAEKIIREVLQTGRPKYSLVMEETGEIHGQDNSNRWIVDPLDGTTNFLHGLPQFCITIALERDREPYAGVIYAPITDQLFFAERGEGAYCNDRRLRVSARTDMSEALFACGLPFKGRAGRELALAETDRVLDQTAGVRRFGSAALDLCMVASGQVDAYWERGLNSWDVTAGTVIVREAGGIVEEIEKSGRPHLAGSILATNSVLHDVARSTILGK